MAAELDFVLTLADLALFVLAVLSWALILVGSVAAVAAVYWIGERWWKR